MQGALEQRIQAKGREIFARLARRNGPAFLSRAWVTSRLMDWSMRNERLKAELFRFIDVLPSLGRADDIARHAQEYLSQPGVDLPPAMRLAVRAGRAVPWLAAAAARQAVRQMAHTFITGQTPQE